VPVVPVVVLAQAWRAAPQHNLSRLLRGCRIVPTDVVDALVVVTATQLAAPVVTSHPDDLTHLAASLGATPALHPL
jgi:hypothetical protein